MKVIQTKETASKFDLIRAAAVDELHSHVGDAQAFESLRDRAATGRGLSSTDEF